MTTMRKDEALLAATTRENTIHDPCIRYVDGRRSNFTLQRLLRKHCAESVSRRRRLRSYNCTTPLSNNSPDSLDDGRTSGRMEANVVAARYWSDAIITSVCSGRFCCCVAVCGHRLGYWDKCYKNCFKYMEISDYPYSRGIRR